MHIILLSPEDVKNSGRLNNGGCGFFGPKPQASSPISHFRDSAPVHPRFVEARYHKFR